MGTDSPQSYTKGERIFDRTLICALMFLCAWNLICWVALGAMLNFVGALMSSWVALRSWGQMRRRLT